MKKSFDKLPDSQVASLAQSGDILACEHLLYKYRNLVRTKTRAYFLAGGDREDLLQVGMIGLWRSIMDFSPQRQISFTTFARLCVERHVITAIKASTRHKQKPLNDSVSIERCTQEPYSESPISELIISPEAELDPEELVLRKEDHRILCENLRRMLSDFEWEVLKHYYLGQSYREIARKLNCNTKSVDNALGRIKRKVSSERTIAESDAVPQAEGR